MTPQATTELQWSMNARLYSQQSAARRATEDAKSRATEHTQVQHAHTILIIMHAKTVASMAAAAEEARSDKTQQRVLLYCGLG